MYRQGTNLCEPHRLEKRRTDDKRRPSARQRGYDTRWEHTRAQHLAAFPHCAWPGCNQSATDVDHADGTGPRGNNNPDNLVSYCHSHHSVKTAQHDGSFGR